MFLHEFAGDNIQVSDIFTDVDELSVCDLIDFMLADSMAL